MAESAGLKPDLQIDMGNTGRMSSSAGARRVRRTRLQQRAFHDHAIRVSLQIFEHDGYEALSMRKLAREVGVPLMSLYRYFPSKVHLIRHVWVDLLLRAHCHAVRAQQQAGSAPDRLHLYLDAWLQYWLDHRRHYWIVFAIRDSGHCGADETEGDWPQPDPWRFLAILDELINGCPGPAGGVGHGTGHSGDRAAGACPHLVESLFCSTLGFLTGVICTSTLGQVDVDALKRDFISGLVDRVAQSRSGADRKDGRATCRKSPGNGLDRRVGSRSAGEEGDGCDDE